LTDWAWFNVCTNTI